MYAREGHVTGQALADLLDIPCGRDAPEDRRLDILIRWGTTRRVAYVPEIRTINMRQALQNNASKFEALEQFDRSGLRVPGFSRDWSSLEFPIMGRADSRMQGRDVKVYHQERDIIELGESDYYIDLIPKVAEYRAHVVDNRIIKASQKVRNDEVWDEEEHGPIPEYDPFVWNYETGWTFRNVRMEHPCINMAISAVSVLQLDFGAVDIIVGENGNGYILEVNTAPGLDDANLRRYGVALAEAAGIGPPEGVDEDA